MVAADKEADFKAKTLPPSRRAKAPLRRDGGPPRHLGGEPWDAKAAGRADVEMHLKARFDKVSDHDLRETPQSTNAVAPATSGPKSR